MITGPSTGRVGDVFEVDISQSTDPENKLRSWKLQWPDETEESGLWPPDDPKRRHTFSDPIPSGDIVLTVSDHKRVRATGSLRGIVIEPSVEPPPTPIDCVLGEEQIVSETPLEACQPDGTQRVDVSWSRPILVEPAHGGAPCEPTTGIRTEARSCVYVPPPDPTDPHAYFRMLAADPACLFAHSLRDQAQLDSLVKLPPSVFWTYDAARDAARLFKPPRNTFSQYPDIAALMTAVGAPVDSGDEGVHGANALRFPLGITSGSIFLTWDLWWGEEFRTNKAPGSFAFKVWFLFCGDAIGATKNYLCMHERYTGSPLPVAGVVSRHHDGPGGGSQLPLTSGIVDVDPFQPTGESAAETGTFLTYDSKWTRYWLEIKLAQSGAAFTEWSDTYLSGAALSGTYDMVSLWIADEDRARARVLYRVPFKRPLNNSTGLPYSMLSAFRWAWDTSTNNLGGLGLVGPLICDGRNMVALHNKVVSESDESLWPQPI